MRNLIKTALLIIWMTFNVHGVPTVHTEHSENHHHDEPVEMYIIRMWGGKIY